MTRLGGKHDFRILGVGEMSSSGMILFIVRTRDDELEELKSSQCRVTSPTSPGSRSITIKEVVFRLKTASRCQRGWL